VILWSLVTSFALYEIPTEADPRFVRVKSGKAGLLELLTAFKVYGIPDTVVHLLSGMLNVNVESRWEIEDVLRHPWLRKPEEMKHRSPSTSYATQEETGEKKSSRKA